MPKDGRSRSTSREWLPKTNGQAATPTTTDDKHEDCLQGGPVPCKVRSIRRRLDHRDQVVADSVATLIAILVQMARMEEMMSTMTENLSFAPHLKF
jgi:hypothetical protein